MGKFDKKRVANGVSPDAPEALLAMALPAGRKQGAKKTAIKKAGLKKAGPKKAAKTIDRKDGAKESAVNQPDVERPDARKPDVKRPDLKKPGAKKLGEKKPNAKKAGPKKAGPKKGAKNRAAPSAPHSHPAAPLAVGASPSVLDRLWAVVNDRRHADPALSHSARLLSRGTAKVAQKFGEEAVECVIEAVGGNRAALVAESADVLYHLIVMWVDGEVRPAEVWAELSRREGVSGVAEKASRARALPLEHGIGTTKIP